MFDEIFYSECMKCGIRIDQNRSFCDNCFNDFFPVDKRCDRCGYPLRVDAVFCNNCITTRYYDRLFIPYWYNGNMKIVLKSIKFRYNLKNAAVLDYLVKKKLFKFDRYDIITVVPSYFFRRFRRFFHPAEYVAKKLSEIFNIKYEYLLERKKDTEYQWKLKRKNRVENIKNAFSPKKELFDLKILLVDDIMTTGATIQECSRMLKDAGASKVDCYVLSKGLFR